MAVIERNDMREGAYGSYFTAGAPVAGTSEVQTLTIGGTPTGGTFKLSCEGQITAAITWSATNATLLANINTALQALGNVGSGNIVATAGTLTAGIGTVLLTFSAALSRRVVSLVAVNTNALTGTAPTLANVQTTPGVNASGLGASVGAKLTDITNGKEYITTSANPPTWVVVGTQV